LAEEHVEPIRIAALYRVLKTLAVVVKVGDLVLPRPDSDPLRHLLLFFDLPHDLMQNCRV